MHTERKIGVGVIGASGYTGADLVRLALCHPLMELVLLTANTYAGRAMDEVFPHFSGYPLPRLIRTEDADWASVDVVFCALPHGTSQDVIGALPSSLRIIDLSADFRLRDGEVYEAWYGKPHQALGLQKTAVYGLSEWYRDQISKARLVACPGCYPTAALLALLPLFEAGVISHEDLIIDAKSGVSGAGRTLKQNTLFCEAGEGLSPYSIARHRHAPEIEQELSLCADHPVSVGFTPHLVPMSRGELVTIYAKTTAEHTALSCLDTWRQTYGSSPFVHVAPPHILPSTSHVRGSNRVLLGAYQDRLPGRVILISTLDNLVKGSSGQAIQNCNLMMGWDETLGLEQVALFP